MTSLDFKPDWFSKPGNTLASLMARRELSAEQLASDIGRDTAFVAGLLTGTVRIDDGTAEALAARLGGSVAFWCKRQQQFDESLARVASDLPGDAAKAWLKSLPMKHMRETGWLGDCSAADDVRTALAYFDVSGPDEWRVQYTSFANEFSFRSSPAFESKLGALAAWLRQGEIQAATIQCEQWDLKLFRARLDQIRALTRTRNPSSFIPLLQELCRQCGVAVVFVQAPKGCRASGATRFVSPTKAMIVMSFRHLSDDHFWFTFFHEAAHLILHGREATFIDGGAADQSDMEAEADAFSARYLIPMKHVDTLMNLRPRVKDVVRFAIKVGVSPGIVVGQMQYHRVIGPGQLNGLKRRYTWEELSAATR